MRAGRLFSVFIFLMLYAAPIAVSAEEHCTVDLKTVFHFHPNIVFYYLPESDVFISPRLLSKRKGAFDADNFFLLQYRFRRRIAEENRALIEKQIRLSEQKLEIRQILNNLLNYHQGMVEQNRKHESTARELDRQYLEDKKKLEEKLTGFDREEKLMKEQLEKLFVATPEERQALLKEIVSDCRESADSLRKKLRISDILYYWSGETGTCEAKVQLIDLCATDKVIDPADRGRISLYMDRTAASTPRPALHRELSILHGGKDRTLDFLELLYDKRKVKQDIRELIFNHLKGEAQ
ncbi:MAG: hypothetical protein PHQ23_16475 [Candidatus Wallbacteria bacterium]|nr:hypothetical protein [Candidatus Wallbacteria bacterium]